MKNNVWNLIINIKNGQLAKRDCVYQKKTKLCELLLQLLWDEGFILGYKIAQTNTNRFKIFLKYLRNGKPVINNIKFISKPGRRIYYSINQIWKIDTNKTFIIFSTSKGLKTITDCKRQHLGGEPLVVMN